MDDPVRSFPVMPSVSSTRSRYLFRVHHFLPKFLALSFCFSVSVMRFVIYYDGEFTPTKLKPVGRKIQANAEVDLDAPVDPPKVEEKIGAVPNGLSTDSDVVKRYFDFVLTFWRFVYMYVLDRGSCL